MSDPALDRNDHLARLSEALRDPDPVVSGLAYARMHKAVAPHLRPRPRGLLGRAVAWLASTVTPR